MTRIGIWTAIVTIGLQAHGFSQEPSFTEGFEGELTEWVLGDTGASPLELVDDPVCEGATSAYSGPPGNRNVVKWTLPLRLVGRLEVWFYDDMVSPKQQIAAASGVPGELMAIVTWSTPYYQYRVTTTYHDTPIKRSKGWHLFAWECDGRETVASIDGTDIHTNRGMGRIREISLGSFWDDSTGWYDDLRAFRRTPTHAGALIEAEDAFEQSGGRIEICEKNGASEMAFRMWDKPGHALEWAMGAGADGPRTLLAKYATGSASATRRVEIGGAAAELKVSNTGGWDQWEYVGVPVTVEGGTNVVRMVNAGGSLNLDWLALAPPGVDAKAYGELLDTWLRGAPWLEAATARIREKADALDVALPEQTALPSLAMSLPSQAELPGLGAGVRDALSEAVGEIVAAELPKLEGIYRTRAAKPLGEE
ncbi:MAG TPA: carbohydrate-binding protein, partial [Armatimonadota bacterium]|nr:carbohydrate-binding protein [Armatimonadota bacterium]